MMQMPAAYESNDGAMSKKARKKDCWIYLLHSKKSAQATLSHYIIYSMTMTSGRTVGFIFPLSYTVSYCSIVVSRIVEA
jgi:hypothetical protein